MEPSYGRCHGLRDGRAVLMVHPYQAREIHRAGAVPSGEGGEGVGV